MEILVMYLRCFALEMDKKEDGDGEKVGSWDVEPVMVVMVIDWRSVGHVDLEMVPWSAITP